MRQRFIRHYFGHDQFLPAGMTFKLASTTEEIQSAYTLCKDKPGKWSCLPSTTTLICKDGNEIIGTISLIADSGFGLPSDNYQNLGRLRKKNLRLIEITGLSVKEKDILLPLTKFAFEYATRFMKGDAFIISASPELRDVFSSVFLFSDHDSGKLLKNERYIEEPEVLQILSFHGIEAKYEEVYGHYPEGYNLHHYFFEMSFSEFQFPKRRYQFAINPIFTPEQLRYFFIERKNILYHLSEKERFYLSDYYHYPEFQDLILKDTDKKPAYRRSSPRIPVRYQASVINSGAGRIRSGEVNQIALHGLSLSIQGMDFEVGEKISVMVDLEESRVKVQGSIVWTSEHGAGVKLDSVPQSWLDINEYAWGLLRSEFPQSA
jgi:hypothetical protein